MVYTARMIHSIKVRNFHSISDEVELSFEVDQKAPQSSRYAKGESGARLSLLQTIVGENASGKTSILKALVFLKWVLTDSFADSQVIASVYEPFAAIKDEPSVVECRFEIEGVLYNYHIKFSQDRILDESLVTRTKSQQRTTKKTVFARTWDAKVKEYTLNDVSGFFNNIPFDKMFDYDLKNSSYLAIARRYGHEGSRHLTKFWRNVETNVELRQFPYRYDFEAGFMLNRLSKDKESLARFMDELKKYRSNGIEKYDDVEGMMVHKYGDKNFSLDIDQESSGTKQLLVLLYKLEDVLENGGIAIIDEFDAYLHPMWLNGLVDKFFDPLKNKKNAQLLMTTHSVQILSLLDKYQINISKKDSGVTSLTRLDEMAGVRADDNYFAKYMAGKYGGVPTIK